MTQQMKKSRILIEKFVMHIVSVSGATDNRIKIKGRLSNSLEERKRKSNNNAGEK